MTGTARIDVDGDERLASTLHGAAEDIGDMSDALDAAARIVEERARSGAPVDTGELARSITAFRSGVEIAVGPNVGVYAAVQEYGSATTPAHPYLAPALDYSNTVIVGYFNDEADRALNKVKGA